MAVYTHVQFIAYKLDTASLGREPQVAPPKPVDPNNPRGLCYLGDASDAVDYRNRCKIMVDAIAEAQAHADVRKDASCLKIFMAPEFYFRGKKGAYPIDFVPDIMKEMRTFVSAKTYEDWLFVFGTATTMIKEAEAGPVEIFNVALVQRGGVTELQEKQGGLGTSFVIYKEYISYGDYIGKHMEDADAFKVPANRSVVLGLPPKVVPVVPPLGSRDVGSKGVSAATGNSELNKNGSSGGGVFVLGPPGTLGKSGGVSSPIVFGLEVCLDHVNARLKSYEPAPGDAFPQIQLITSAGLNVLQDKRMAVKPQGLIFLVDGTAAGPVGVWKHAGAKEALPDPDPVDISEKKKAFVGDHAKYFWGGGSPELLIYAALPMPPAVVVPLPKPGPGAAAAAAAAPNSPKKGTGFWVAAAPAAGGGTVPPPAKKTASWKPATGAAPPTAAGAPPKPVATAAPPPVVVSDSDDSDDSDDD
jgi:hypothetical protein